MAELPVLTALAMVAVASLVAIAALLGLLLFEVRRMLCRLQALVPECDRAMQEASKTMREVRQILGATRRAADQASGLVGRVCQAAAEVVEQATSWKDRVSMWFGSENAAPSGRSRRQSRRVS